MTQYIGYKFDTKNVLEYLSELEIMFDKINIQFSYKITKDKTSTKFFIKNMSNLEAEIVGNLIFVDENSKLNDFFKNYYSSNIKDEKIINEEEEYVKKMLNRGFIQKLVYEKFSIERIEDGSYMIFEKNKKLVGDFKNEHVRYDDSCEKLDELVKKYQ
jgi:hypothetical protein